jgi:hypothetical protein
MQGKRTTDTSPANAFSISPKQLRLTFSSDGFQYPNAPRIKSTGAKQAAALINARRRYLVAAVLNSARVNIVLLPNDKGNPAAAKNR